MQALFWPICASASFGLAWWLIAPLRPDKNKRRLGSFILAVLPLLALVFYVWLGAAGRADAPLMPRLQGSLQDLPPGAILVRLEEKLRQNPDDAKGWRLLARMRTSLGAHDKAADAWQRVVDLGEGAKDNGEAFVGLGEALIEQEGGVISDAAIFWIDKALGVAPKNMSARFWRGLAWQQQGETAKARAHWLALRQEVPDKTPLAKMLDAQISAPDGQSRK